MYKKKYIKRTGRKKSYRKTVKTSRKKGYKRVKRTSFRDKVLKIASPLSWFDVIVADTVMVPWGVSVTTGNT